jgi:MOSC domain-containing protein YiiM
MGLGAGAWGLHDGKTEGSKAPIGMTRSAVRQMTREELETGLDAIRRSPADEGILRLIVRRPEIDGREVLHSGTLDPAHGLVGDSWAARQSAGAVDGSVDPVTQLTIMNARVIALLARDPARWPLAGDQLFVDLDLSEANLPAGIRLAMGSAIVEVSAEPHTGCAKFVRRFGLDAMKFVNSPTGRTLRLRGLNARVIRAGEITVGDVVRKEQVQA